MKLLFDEFPGRPRPKGRKIKIWITVAEVMNTASGYLIQNVTGSGAVWVRLSERSPTRGRKQVVEQCIGSSI